MIKSVTITNYVGDTVKINLTEAEPKHGMIIQSITGLGPPTANVRMTELSNMDGALYNSAKANKRNIVLSLIFTFAPTIEDTRLRSYKFFPIKKPLTCMIETDNRIVEALGYVETNTPDVFSPNESCQISIICDDPYFYSAGPDGIKYVVFYGINPMFEFIFSNESLTAPMLEFSSIEKKKENNVYYEGDAEVGITIIIHATGPVEGIKIYNTGTREFMYLKVYGDDKLIAGDTVIITSERSNKKVTLIREGRKHNILNKLDRTSNWFTLVKGDNLFAFTADTGDLNLQFRIEYRNLYEGV